MDEKNNKDLAVYDMGLKEIYIIGDLIERSIYGYTSNNLTKWFKNLKAIKLVIYDRIADNLREKLSVHEKKIHLCLSHLGNYNPETSDKNNYDNIKSKTSTLIEDYDYMIKMLLSDQGYKMRNRESSTALFGQDDKEFS